MRFLIFILLALLLGGGAAFAMFPLSVAAEFAAREIPEFRYVSATGSVWNGKLSGVAIGDQPVGDLTVKTEMLALFQRKAAGKLGLIREGFAGESDFDWPLFGPALELDNLKLTGKAGLVPGMPDVVALGGGDFVLEVEHLRFARNVCESAQGEVWTDALAKVDLSGWVGPELRGPVACQEGNLVMQADGRAPTGEDVSAVLNMSYRLDLDLTATVLNAQGGAVEALTGIGFKPEGTALVIRQALDS